MTGAIADGQWRCKGNRVARNGRDLLDLVGRPVASREPRHGCRQIAGRPVIRTFGIRSAAIISRLQRIVHVPGHVIALPDFRSPRETRRCRLPRRTGDLVQQDECPGPEIRRVGDRDGIRSLSTVGSQALGRRAVGAVIPSRGADNDDRLCVILVRAGINRHQDAIGTLDDRRRPGSCTVGLDQLRHAGARATQRDGAMDQQQIVDDERAGVEHHHLSGGSAVQRGLDRS